MPRLVPPVVAAGTLASKPQPVIDGDGIVLRPWEPTDAPTIVEAYADPEIQHWHFRRCDDLEEAHAWRAEVDEAWAAERSANWAIVRATTPDDPPVGRIALHLDLADGWAEISYWVVPGARGEGVATRAVRALTSWSFEQLGLHRLEIRHSVMNPASCRVAERAGFAAEGTLHAAQQLDDGWHDLHVHGRVRDGGWSPPP